MGQAGDLYRTIQSIPYRLGFIEDTSLEGNCVSKSIAFERDYLGNEHISYIEVKFNWQNLLDWEELESLNPIAKEIGIATLVKKLESPIGNHLVLQVDGPESLFYVDSSWDPSMWNLGFPKRVYGEGIALPKEAIVDINPTFFDVPRYKINRRVKKALRLIKKPEEGKFNLAFNRILYHNMAEPKRKISENI